MKNIKQRIEYIRKAEEAADQDPKNARPYAIKNWRGGILNRNIVSIPAEMLMFRIENSRTLRQQLKYLRERPHLPKGLFDDPESTAAQNAQEEILLSMVKSTGQDLLSDLGKRGQEDPAIITFDGFIVNGNRRTAALKDLGEQYIDCVVLPKSATPKDLYELEQELQLAKQFREDYHWINELWNFRQGIKDKRYHFNEADLAKRLRLDTKEMRSKLTMIDLVDSFLIWRKTPAQYDCEQLDDAEQVFADLEKALRKNGADPNKQAELRNAVFHLIEKRPTTGRLYAYVKELIRNFDQMYSRMQTSIEASGAKAKSTATKTNGRKEAKNGKKDDPLASFLGDDEATPDLFGDYSKVKTISSAIVESLADIKAENKQLKDNEAVYNSVSDALRSLQGLIIDENTSKLNETQQKLDQLVTVAKELSTALKKQQRKAQK